MSDAIITVENLGKKYSLRHLRDQRYIALRDVLVEKATGLFRRRRRNGQQDQSPVVSSQLSSGPRTEDFWALRDINFSVRQGEVIGIIGRNGAGKSTLLKILSRITDPTEGRVRIKGRVASLLEVGTGFHPELTGRENIFLNGAILGMTRAEINKKFNEIVAFAEIERFLDTPVKRYSSGMYVRLAFAVAAHLEPEILVVDEVLAVGDAEFQKKCLGKMQNVASNEGRTVLFVSHNMAAIKSLTRRGILLNAGQLVFDGASDEAIKTYTQSIPSAQNHAEKNRWGRGVHTAVLQVQLLDDEDMPTHQYTPGQPFKLRIVFETDGTSGLSLDGSLVDESLMKIAYLSDYQFHGRTLPARSGKYELRLELESLWLAAGSYSFDITTAVANSNWDHYVEMALKFDVTYCNPHGLPWNLQQSYGYGRLALVSTGPPSLTPLEECADEHQNN
jgi:lipopolysaccharide transport system ATP-binding protein